MFEKILNELRETNGRLERIESLLRKEGKNIMSALADLQAQVAANTTVEQSSVTLIQGLAAQLQAAIDAGNDSAQLIALAANMKSSADALAAAVAANTPAAPPAPPTT